MPAEVKGNKDVVVRIANELDAALARHDDPAAICRALRTMQARPKDVFASMLRAWRIFSADFRSGCCDADRRLVYSLSDDVPSVIGDNYYRQVRGVKMVEARRRASTMRGRVNICLNEPFADGARHEVHDVFSRKDTVEGYAKSLASLPNLGANDMASTIWAGRIYQDDFFKVSPQRLKLKMLQYLHEVSPVIAQTFVTQIVRDRSLPRRYRVLAWTEGVLRPHSEHLSSNAEIGAVYAASRKSGDIRRGLGMNGTVHEWLSKYVGGDRPARFDMERTLRGFKLSRRIIDWLCQERYLNVLTYYLNECRTEFEKAYPLSDFAGHVCASANYSDAEQLLGVVEKLSPGMIAAYYDSNGANLLERTLYRYRDKDPVNESWLRMCFGRKSGLRPLVAFLHRMGCEDVVPNSIGITWVDIEDAAKEKFDGSVFREVSSEDRDDSEFYAGIDDLFKATAPYMDDLCDEDYLLNDQQD